MSIIHCKELVDKIVSVLNWSEDMSIEATGQGDFTVAKKDGLVFKKAFKTEDEALEAIFELLAEKIADEVLR